MAEDMGGKVPSVAKTDDATGPPIRLWGIDLIAGVYALVALLCVWLCFVGTQAGCVFGVIGAPLFALLTLGLYQRHNTARVVLVVLLALALVGETLLAAYFGCVAMDIVDSPTNRDPRSELLRIPVRAGLTLAMLFYLCRANVKQEFVRRKY